MTALAVSIHLTASRRSMRLGSFMSDVSFLQLVHKVVAGPPRVGHDGKRRVFVCVGNKRPAIGDEEVFYVPGLAVLVEHGFFGIRTEAGRADLMDDIAAG